MLKQAKSLIRRREFVLAAAGAALVSPKLTAAQSRDQVQLVGMLMPFSESDPEALIRVAAFRQRLQDQPARRRWPR